MPGLTSYSNAYKPFTYPEYVNRAIEHDKIFWAEHEADLAEDVRQWKTGDISDIEKYHITSILRLFTQSDVVVGGSYVDVFLPRIKNNEARMMMLSFAQRESVHQRAYALLNDTLGLAEEEYLSFLEYQELSEKVEFMQNFNPDTPEGLGLSLARTVCNEGVSLFSAFVMLLNYQREGKMRGMCEIVEWSIRDETMHVEGMSEVFKQYCKENPYIVTDNFKLEIYEMFRQAVTLEDKVIDLSYSQGGIKGLDASEVKQYIRYLADRRLIQLGLKANFHVESNPLPWLDWVISGDSFKNFFEGRVTDYSSAGMTGSWGW
jgi:ribonucleotide reductase beta subunit family protein with ferritin-like domain